MSRVVKLLLQVGPSLLPFADAAFDVIVSNSTLRLPTLDLSRPVAALDDQDLVCREIEDTRGL